MTEEEKQKRLYEMQSPSTKRVMGLHAQGKRANEQPLPENWLAVPDAKTYEERVNARSLSFKEVAIEEHLRRTRGEYLADVQMQYYQSKNLDMSKAPAHIYSPDKGSVDEAKRERAVGAFMFIKKAFTDLMKSWGLFKERPKSLIERVREEVLKDEE